MAHLSLLVLFGSALEVQCSMFALLFVRFAFLAGRSQLFSNPKLKIQNPKLYLSF